MGADNTFGETNFNFSPPAEGAEEILKKYIIYCKNVLAFEGKIWVVKDVIPTAMQEFAALHAKRLAEKMVEEKMEQYKAQFKDKPNPLEVNPYDSKGIKRIRNRKIH